MRIVGLPRAFYHAGRRPPPVLSPKGEQRLRWLTCWQKMQEHGLSGAESSQALGLPRSTLYRWRKRLREQGRAGLEGRSRRPHRLRHPTWSPELAQAVLALRERYPRWGKDKLVVLLRREGREVSTSMVGRILTQLKAKRILREPPNHISARKRSRPRPYARRKPKDYLPQAPGDLVQVDTLDVRPVPGMIYKHFTSRDTISPAGTWLRYIPELPPPQPGPSWIPWWPACPSRSRPCRWTEALSSPPPSRRNASAAVSCSSCCRHILRNSTPMWNGHTEPILRSSMRSMTAIWIFLRSTKPFSDGNGPTTTSGLIRLWTAGRPWSILDKATQSWPEILPPHLSHMY